MTKKRYIYKVRYIAKDGTPLSLSLKSEHVIVAAHRLNINSNPLLIDVHKAMNRVRNRPESNMAKHGGPHILKEIENMDTGGYLLFNLYI